MLLGRGRECGAIERLLGAAHGSVAAVLVVRGAPGMGKTALLEWATETSPSSQSVSVRCSEGAERFRWSVVREIVSAFEANVPSLLPAHVENGRNVGDEAGSPLAIEWHEEHCGSGGWMS